MGVGKARQQCLCKPQHDDVWHRKEATTQQYELLLRRRATRTRMRSQTVPPKIVGVMAALFVCAAKASDQGRSSPATHLPHVSSMHPACTLPHPIPGSRMCLFAGTGTVVHNLLTPGRPPLVGSPRRVLPGHAVFFGNALACPAVLLWHGTAAEQPHTKSMSRAKPSRQTGADRHGK